MKNQRVNLTIDRLNIRLKGVSRHEARETVNGLGDRLANHLTVDAAGNVIPRDRTQNEPVSLQDRIASKIARSIHERT